MNKAIFLDRDGVLIEDAGFFTDHTEMKLFDSVPKILAEFKRMGFSLIVVTNQAVVARGISSENNIIETHKYLSELIVKNGGPSIDAFYYCPHHPNADIAEYRENCECRKPSPGMLLKAAEDFDIDLQHSFMIGDRISDVIAGKEAGCKSIQLKTGRHKDKTIESSTKVEWDIQADFECSELPEALNWILQKEA